VLLDGDGEDALVGAHVSLGDAVIEVGRRIQRCVMTVRPQPGGIEGDLQVLRTILRAHPPAPEGARAVREHLAVGMTARVGWPFASRWKDLEDCRPRHVLAA
jgi:uncharacterized protein